MCRGVTFMILFILFLSISTNCEPLKSSKYPPELKKGMIPESILTLISQMDDQQKAQYLQIYKENINKQDTSSFLNELRAKMPDLYKQIASTILEILERSQRMNEEANQFLSFYGTKSSKMSDSDQDITKFLRAVVPRWNKLGEQAKKDFRQEYPKLAEFLDDKKVHQLAGIEN